MRIFCFIEFSSNFLFLFHLFLLKLKKFFHLSLPFIYFSFPPNISCLSSLKNFAKYCNQKIQQYLLTLNFHFAESVFRIKNDSQKYIDFVLKLFHCSNRYSEKHVKRIIVVCRSKVHEANAKSKEGPFAIKCT